MKNGEGYELHPSYHPVARELVADHQHTLSRYDYLDEHWLVREVSLYPTTDALYRIGLLGCVQHDWVRGEWVQRFLRPGEGTLGPERVLPRSTNYLVHPALSDVIGRMNPSYLDGIERTTIVGYERPWRETGEAGGAPAPTVRSLCVLKGDIAGFGGLMRAGMDGPVREALEDAVRRNAQDAVCVEARGGDAVLIAHEDPVALARTARHLIDDVFRAPGQPRLRVALHYSADETARIMGSSAGAVRVMQHRAMTKLRKLIADRPAG